MAVRRRCAMCAEPTLEIVRDQPIRGGSLEHWECSSCGAKAEVPGLLTTVLFFVLGAFFIGAGLFSSRFSGSGTEIAIMRIGLVLFGASALGWGAGKRVWLERKCPVARDAR